MNNNLNKAAWLMGTHLDSAYSSDGIDAYTLFHNPSEGEGGKLDLVECIFDKRKGTKSHNAQHLAAVLAHNNERGKKVKWVAHSQGAIIFCAALEVYRINYGGKPLRTQELAIHGSGANLERLANAASSVGLKTHAARNNPYDMVPNLAGANDLSPSSFVRSLVFKGLVKNGTPTQSPHTLPFLGLKNYRDQLQLEGNWIRHRIVSRFIKKLPDNDPRL